MVNQLLQSVYSVITNALARARPHSRRSRKMPEMFKTESGVCVDIFFVDVFCVTDPGAGMFRETHHHSGIHTNPRDPHTTNTLRQPYSGASSATINGAAMLPMVMPT